MDVTGFNEVTSRDWFDLGHPNKCAFVSHPSLVVNF